MLSSIIALAFVAAAVQAQTAGVTTRYWDCCKPSCAWPGKAALSSPLQTCDKNDRVLSDPNTKSACDGGGSFMCTKNAPIVISPTLAYGTAATALTGESEASSCCQCYELTFTSGPVVGQKMVVQSINTGGDVGSNQFDIAIPGGGLGIYDACSSEFGVSSSSFGARYGGVGDKAGCAALPQALQSGCNFRFGWYKGADNPSVSYKKVACPSELTALTGCVRSDDKPVNTPPQTTVKTVTAAPATTTAKTTSSMVKTTSAAGSGSATQVKWGQCGGIGYNGPTKCVSGTTCKFNGDYYSQCI